MMPLRAKHLTAAYRTAPIEMMVGRDPELDGAHDQHEALEAKLAQSHIDMGMVDVLMICSDVGSDAINALADLTPKQRQILAAYGMTDLARAALDCHDARLAEAKRGLS